MTSTWVKRARSRTLPASAHGARAYSGRATFARDGVPREEHDRALAEVRLDILGRSLTVADLQRALARESE